MSGPEAIQRQTKIDSLTKYLSRILDIDRAKIQASFDEHSIVDFGHTIPFSGHIVHDNLQVRLSIRDAVINDFIKEHTHWCHWPRSAILILKEYAENETRPRISHAYLSVRLISKWTEPDRIIHLMFPIEDSDSECQQDYLFRAFTVQLGACYLKDFYSEKLQEEMMRLDMLKCGYLDFLKLFIRNMGIIAPRGYRILVVFHGARVDQTLELLRLLRVLASNGPSPIFQILISGQGADAIAEGTDRPQTFQLPFPEEYNVLLLPIPKPEFTEDELLTNPEARRQWHRKRGWNCRVWRKELQQLGVSSAHGTTSTPSGNV